MPPAQPEKWRFIADAACPHCGQRDRVRVEMGSGQVQCVACRRDIQIPPAAGGAQATPVRLLDPQADGEGAASD